MPRIKKRQLMVEEGDEGRTAAARFYSLAAACPHRQGHLPLHDLLSKICDTTPWAARSPPRAWSAATCRCARLGPRGGVGAPRSARAKTGGAPRGRSSSRLTTFVGPMPASASPSPGPCRPTARARPRSGALPAGDGSRGDRSGLEPARGLAVSGAPGAPASGGGSTPRGGKRHGEGACADGRRPHGRCRGRHQGSEGHWEAVLPLSSRPLGPCDGRQAGLVYLPARWRDTTRSWSRNSTGTRYASNSSVVQT